MKYSELKRSPNLGVPLTILKIKEVKNRTTFSRSTLYLKMKEGTFPKQISLGARSVGWLESDINNWISSRINLSVSNASVGGPND